MTKFYIIFLGALLSFCLPSEALVPITYYDGNPFNFLSTDSALANTQRDAEAQIQELVSMENIKGISGFTEASQLVSSAGAGLGFSSTGGLTLSGIRNISSEYMGVANGLTSFSLSGLLTGASGDLFLDSSDPNIKVETIPDKGVQVRDLSKKSASEVLVDATAVLNATSTHKETQDKMNKEHSKTTTEFEDQKVKSETDLAMNARQLREFESFLRGVQIDSVSSFKNFNHFGLGKLTSGGDLEDSISGAVSSVSGMI